MQENFPLNNMEIVQNHTFILLIRSVNFELNKKLSVWDTVFEYGFLIRILYFAQDNDWSTLTKNSSGKFSRVAISE